MYEQEIDRSQLIRTEEELRALIGFPGELVERKMITQLDAHCRDFIARSPFVLLSTSNEAGQCDVSPRGDDPGFVHVLDDRHLVVPERPGNKRIDSLRNIIANPHVGMLFMIPGLGETLRVNGRASITKDEKLLSRMAVKDRVPMLGIIVEAEECYMHCAKAFLRSQLWKPEFWPGKELLPSPAAIIAAHASMEGVTADTVADRLADGYKNRLY
ncbi:phosphohydrolase [Paenibacillus sp. CCS19]|uniref:pyridoxamine 5'-phosphate oxidase family protein n=1 Tax=Paenibacillus sp. CCS19 TaxID=3158387 RepID=UPI00256B2B0C|nr:pyridoxamine 5'-phosphate oxidase family protein [Paenibacillus cellulosilyticus]GMK40510.1 phosphohydrolase [Paenibacillus cellulosilyticus]